MIPGIGLFYSGMTKRKSALSLLWLSLMCMAVTSVQWFLIGYSLTFSLSGSPFIGDLAHIITVNVLDGPALGTGAVSDIAFCFFQLMFAATVTTSAVAERGRIWLSIVFVFVWCTFVYNVVAYWAWCPNGWANVLGVLDYAGGVPVHMTAGTSALSLLSYAWQTSAVLSWFGCFGFNGGSGLIISSRAVLACVVTNLAACTGGFTWCMLDYLLLKPKHRFTLFGFCMGAMAGLVCITPGSGFVSPASSLVFGIGGSTCVYFGRKIKILFEIDGAFDIFAQHGVGGFVGCLLTGFFARKYIPAIEKTTILGGWLDGHWIQLAYQLALAFAGFVWSFLMTILILFLLNKMPGLTLRIAPERELQRIDYAQFNEFTHDYILIQPDLYAATSQSNAADSSLTVNKYN